ncbi:hypothetical protein EPA93_03340 [Ktedonosporobacter rubrisoli]|uniref:Pyrrolo-quinoline quinone repeat domain-containing protein n=1 Tax=Ktedonosporobacter rubrisoli TaxID=2509675 RepID=A0A4P6JJ17_KTERU|nr:PQQ-binding-like beta-propeller repeat protein [Ktedonosporobacter rubrisoli]QBD75079.1 hypothetical protein EPA93_03340 [Ktedonosporobacter rubrisoli]
MHEKEHFKPEAVDERIEQLASSIEARNGTPGATVSTDERLVETLQHMYRLDISEEDRKSLERARLRIVSAKTRAAPSQTAPGRDSEASNPQRLYGKKSISMHTQSRFPGSFGKRTVRWLSTLAAVLVISLVVGSLLVLTNVVRPSGSQGQTSNVSTAAHPAAPQAKVTDGQQNIYSADLHNVYKLSGKDGSVIWKRPINDVVQHNYFLWVEHGTVLLATGLGAPALYALKASDGTILWHKTLDQGLHYAPDIMDDTVFVLRQKDGTLFAFDAQSGSEKWHYTPVAKGMIYILSNGSVYLKLANSSLYALNAATGTERWHYTEAAPQQGHEFSISTIAAGDALYDVSGNNLYALQARDGKLLWMRQASSASQSFGGLFVNGNKIYAETDEPVDATGHSLPPHVYAFNTGDGQQLWRLDGFVGRIFLNAGANQPDGMFLAYRSPNDDNTLAYVINAKDGSTLRKLPNSCESPPGKCARYPFTVIGKKLYVIYTQKHGGSLLETYDLNTGARTSKSLDIPQGYALSASVSEGVVYLTPLANGNTISAVRLSDGAVLWKHALDQESPNTVRAVVAP